MFSTCDHPLSTVYINDRFTTPQTQSIPYPMMPLSIVLLTKHLATRTATPPKYLQTPIVSTYPGAQTIILHLMSPKVPFFQSPRNTIHSPIFVHWFVTQILLIFLVHLLALPYTSLFSYPSLFLMLGAKLVSWSVPCVSSGAQVLLLRRAQVRPAIEYCSQMWSGDSSTSAVRWSFFKI